MASFLCLPVEIRLRVYQYIIPGIETLVHFGLDRNTCTLRRETDPSSDLAELNEAIPSWKLVNPNDYQLPTFSWVFACQTIFDEAVPLLYGCLRFHFCGDEDRLLADRNGQAIPYIPANDHRSVCRKAVVVATFVSSRSQPSI